jgi:hypothetical protein
VVEPPARIGDHDLVIGALHRLVPLGARAATVTNSST